MHIKRFNWSQKTYSILYRLGIIDIEDFEGVSIKALKEMGIPKTTIKQIEDICKVHNIETKETEYTLKVYEILVTIKDDYDSSGKYTRTVLIVATTCEEAINEVKQIWKNELLKKPEVRAVMGPIKPGYRLI